MLYIKIQSIILPIKENIVKNLAKIREHVKANKLLIIKKNGK